VVEYLARHPAATMSEVLAASADARQEVYSWLHRDGHKSAQDRRIRTLLESEAFVEIHRQWARVGYPFESLVPSYATAIGSSADRPSALAELLGILVNDGVRRSTERLSRFHFGAGTPFEAVLEREPAPSEVVLHQPVAAMVRHELLGVVRAGTAARARKSVELADGRKLDVGGKTGTGDNRTKRAGEPAKREGVKSRTATFVFTVGDRYYGTIVMYVPGEAAADYTFTSSAAVQVFNYLLPSLEPVFERPPRAGEWSLFGEPAPAEPRGPARLIADGPPASGSSHAAAPGASSSTGAAAGAGAGSPLNEAIELDAVPAPRTIAMVDLDRAAPSDTGEPPRGFRFPDPAWREMGAGGDSRDARPNPFSAAVLSSWSTRVVPVVRRRGRRPQPLAPPAV
jgi:membrane peptidoglycan carboxypeptidase